MASFNRVILAGNLTRDVELRHIPSGTAVADVGLAVNDRVKRGDEWVDEVSFIDLTLWARQAENAAEYLSKGSAILVEGRLKQETWEDKEGGKRSKLKVVVDQFKFIGGKNTNTQQSEEKRETVSAGADSGQGDIPF